MNKLLVFQSDFGTCDAAVSSMEGVVFNVSMDINVRHITHEITPFNIFEASYRLYQTIGYWPEGTVFVSIVDPGVGSSRSSVVAKVKGNKYIVTPNNGTLTHLNKYIGIEEVRIIDEKVNRLTGSEQSYTFHGRDVYAYTGARLASGVISYEEVGPKLENDSIEMLEIYDTKYEDGVVTGQIDILDGKFGSLWTSVTIEDFKKLGVKMDEMVHVCIYNGNKKAFDQVVKYCHSFAYVSLGFPLVYLNSVNHMAVGINQGNFSEAYKIGVGSPWTITFSKD